MTREDIIRMARKAGFDIEVEDMFNYQPQHSFIGTDENIERFAALVAAAEREQCAKVCEVHGDMARHAVWMAEECAALIRARGKDAAQT